MVALPASLSALFFPPVQHDSGPTCAPYGTNRQEAEEGNYIMFASATMGDKANNDNFSTCSLDNITRVLEAVLNQRYGKVNCFQSESRSYCMCVFVRVCVCVCV